MNECLTTPSYWVLTKRYVHKKVRLVTETKHYLDGRLEAYLSNPLVPPVPPWYVLSRLWNGAYKRTLAVNR